MHLVNTDIRKLQHAVALDDQRSFVGAAERLNMTQSALTRSIQALERGVGTRLFDRDRGGVRPTSHGRLFLARAREMLAAAHDLDAFMAELAQGSAGQVRIGLGPLIASILLPRLLVRMLELRPGVQIAVTVQAAGLLIGELLADRLDFVIGTELAMVPDARIAATRLARVTPALIVRAGHPLAGGSALKMAALAPYPLVSGTVGERVAKGLAGVPIAVHCDDFAALKALTLATDAVWLAAEPAATAELEAETLIALDLADPDVATPFAVSLLRMRGRTASSAIRLAEDVARGLLSRSEG